MVNVEPENFRESRFRSVCKGLSWRLLASATTMTVAWIIVGDWQPALAVTGIEFFAKLALYYFHERAWQMVPRGTLRGVIKSKNKIEPQD